MQTDKKHFCLSAPLILNKNGKIMKSKYIFEALYEFLLKSRPQNLKSSNPLIHNKTALDGNV